MRRRPLRQQGEPSGGDNEEKGLRILCIQPFPAAAAYGDKAALYPSASETGADPKPLAVG